MSTAYQKHSHRAGSIAPQEVSIKFDGTPADAQQLKDLFEEFIARTNFTGARVSSVTQAKGVPQASTVVTTAQYRTETVKKMVEVEEIENWWECASCGVRLTEAKVKRMRCYACGAFLLNDRAGISDLGTLIQKRMEMDTLNAEFEVTSRDIVYHDAESHSSALLVRNGVPTDHPRANGFAPVNVPEEETVA